jgi:hypothetical protein
MRSQDDGATWSPPVEITSSVKAPDWTWYATGPGKAERLGGDAGTGSEANEQPADAAGSEAVCRVRSHLDECDGERKLVHVRPTNNVEIMTRLSLRRPVVMSRKHLPGA